MTTEKKPAKKTASKSVVVLNNRKNPVSVDGVEIAPQGSVTLTKEQAENEALMAKISHGVKTGVFSFGE